MGVVYTKDAADIFAPEDIDGRPRGADMAEAATWGTEVEDAIDDVGVLLGTTSFVGADNITDDHHGHTIFLGGAGFYAVDLAAITIPIFRCELVNTSNSRCRTFRNGGSKLRLKPGQTLKVMKDPGGTIRTSALPRAIMLSPTIHVKADGSGSDDPAVTDGLDESAPFATLTAADQFLRQELDCGGSFPTIIADGVFDDPQQFIGNPPGAPVVFLMGSSPRSCTIRATSAKRYSMILGDGATYEIANVQTDGNGYTSQAIQGHQKGVLDINAGCGFGSHGNAVGGGHMKTDGAGFTLNINASYQVNGAGGAADHIAVPSPCCVNIAGGITVAISNNPNIGTWFRLIAGGVINIGPTISVTGAPLAGCQKWSCGPLSMLALGGNGASIPGSAAGSPPAGSAPAAATGWVTA